MIRTFQKIYKKSLSIILKQTFLGGCRFYPTCSEYFCQAVEKHGIVKGISYSLIRFLKCNPFNPSNYYDPVK